MHEIRKFVPTPAYDNANGDAPFLKQKNIMTNLARFIVGDTNAFSLNLPLALNA